MIYIGIDNGSSGGVAGLSEAGEVLFVRPMPPTDVELYTYLKIARQMSDDGQTIAVLEHAQSFPKMGVSSAFNYGRGYGATQMALAAIGIRFDIIVPRKWQAALACLSGGDKNVTKRRAEQLFPGTKITHAIADALLIAEYCRRLHKGSLPYGKEAGSKAKGREADQGEARRDSSPEVSAETGERKDQKPAKRRAPRHGASHKSATQYPV